MAESHSSNADPSSYQPCERRFRSSSYFLEDQLRCSEAVSDFQSIKHLIQRAAAFNFSQAFRFQSVEVKSD